MSRIRVAYLIDTIEPNFGGTETQLVRLIERIDRRRIEPVLCFLRDSQWFQENRELCRQYDVGFTSFFSLNSWKKFFEYVRFLRQANIDVLQTQFRDSNILGTIAAKLARIPVLIASRRNEGYWLNHLELAILHILNPFTTHFIVNSQSVKRYVQRVEHIASSKIEVIYNGVILYYPAGV
ncbi:MAG: glycosyltransferase [Gammaproteobacteria bacterium]